MILDCTHYTVLCDTNSNNITIALPTIIDSIKGRIYVIKNIGDGSNSINIDSNGINIDFSPAIYNINTPLAVVKLQSDGTQWWII